MKAKNKKTGKIVEVTRSEQYGVYVDENRVCYALDELDFDYEENEHLQDVRERAAIAAMQGTINMLGCDRWAFSDVVVEGYNGEKKTYPNEIAQFAVACANALIEELKKK